MSTATRDGRLAGEFFADSHRIRSPRPWRSRGGVQQFSGPRWIAEPVPLMDDEATLILEQEMEKAYAAFAAADAFQMNFASAPDPYASLPVAEDPSAGLGSSQLLSSRSRTQATLNRSHKRLRRRRLRRAAKNQRPRWLKSAKLVSLRQTMSARTRPRRPKKPQLTQPRPPPVPVQT